MLISDTTIKKVIIKPIREIKFKISEKICHLVLFGLRILSGNVFDIITILIKLWEAINKKRRLNKIERGRKLKTVLFTKRRKKCRKKMTPQQKSR